MKRHKRFVDCLLWGIFLGPAALPPVMISKSFRNYCSFSTCFVYLNKVYKEHNFTICWLKTLQNLFNLVPLLGPDKNFWSNHHSFALPLPCQRFAQKILQYAIKGTVQRDGSGWKKFQFDRSSLKTGRRGLPSRTAIGY